ncbi:hypothetical protein L208DRAFT_533188 [Tricholoma matsutake]|nr:hypothetical protein L208DRAFT_533188 [Tricholoma matsutake 945]
MERNDKSDMTLTRHESLRVPGLAGKCPSVLVGDSILVQKQGETQGHWFEGRVHVLRKEEVGLRFHGSFSWTAAERYNVRFKLNRIPMWRQHQATDPAFAQARMLFPSEAQYSGVTYSLRKNRSTPI